SEVSAKLLPRAVLLLPTPIPRPRRRSSSPPTALTIAAASLSTLVRRPPPTLLTLSRISLSNSSPVAIAANPLLAIQENTYISEGGYVLTLLLCTEIWIFICGDIVDFFVIVFKCVIILKLLSENIIKVFIYFVTYLKCFPGQINLIPENLI
ncbi:unnamed protein product, partial [Meganyctiphanes norvegica]